MYKLCKRGIKSYIHNRGTHCRTEREIIQPNGCSVYVNRTAGGMSHKERERVRKKNGSEGSVQDHYTHTHAILNIDRECAGGKRCERGPHLSQSARVHISRNNRPGWSAASRRERERAFFYFYYKPSTHSSVLIKHAHKRRPPCSSLLFFFPLFAVALSRVHYLLSFTFVKRQLYIHFLHVKKVFLL